MSQPDPMVLEVRALRAAVLEQGGLIQRQGEAIEHLTRMLLTSDDRRAGKVLLPLAADLVSGAAFTGPGLMAAALKDRTSTGQAARELLRDMATESGGMRAFGRLLARLEGVPLAGYRLEAAGEHAEGRCWRIVRVSGGE